MAWQSWRRMGADGRTRWIVSALVLITGLAAARLEFVQGLEWKTEDARLRFREGRGVGPHEALLLLAIDEESLNMQGQWPFPRPQNGFLMEFLNRDPGVRPAVLTWDILFVDRSFDPTMDEAMAAPVAELAYPVVMGAVADPASRGPFSGGQPVVADGVIARVSANPALENLPDERGCLLPIPELLPVTRAGFLDAAADGDGVVRRLPLVIRIGDEVFPSLVLQTLLAYRGLGVDAVSIEPGVAITIRRGDGTAEHVPIDERGRYLINHHHEVRTAENPGGLPQVGYYDFYVKAAGRDAGATEKLPTAGRIVVVGQTASGLTDIGPSPLRGQGAKVMFHLNALDNILKGDYLTPVPLAPVLLGVLAAGLGIGWILDRRGYRVYAVTVPVLGLAVVAAATGALVSASVMAPLAVPLGALLLQQGAFTTLKIREEQAKRDRIRGMFATYVAPALVDRMVQSGEEPKLGGVEEEITAYFSDIEAFSGFSEKLTPPRLVELMNEYLTACTDIVQAEGGTLDKFIGDAVVAMYGAPLALPNHGHRAVVAALRVHRRCGELRAKWKAEQAEKGWPDIVANLQTRIGLNLGRAVVGNMGSHTRFNYTMMGDTVNLAARMESGAKAYGVYTLVTESVVEASRRADPDAVLFRLVDRIVVKGRTQPVAVFEAMALREDVTPAMAEGAGIFAEGLEKYHAQDWDGARSRFERSAPLETHKHNNPSLVMLERVALMAARPPGAGWDGVWRMTTK